MEARGHPFSHQICHRRIRCQPKCTPKPNRHTSNNWLKANTRKSTISKFMPLSSHTIFNRSRATHPLGRRMIIPPRRFLGIQIHQLRRWYRRGTTSQAGGICVRHRDAGYSTRCSLLNSIRKFLNLTTNLFLIDS